jgi:hypothetical protein
LRGLAPDRHCRVRHPASRSARAFSSPASATVVARVSRPAPPTNVVASNVPGQPVAVSPAAAAARVPSRAVGENDRHAEAPMRRVARSAVGLRSALHLVSRTRRPLRVYIVRVDVIRLPALVAAVRRSGRPKREFAATD